MKTTTKVLTAIANLNLEPIKNKLMDPEDGEGWSRAKVEAMDLEYRRFLHLMHTFPNQSASPTRAVDTFWHYHILDTQRYAADCDEVFGCFMHHNPYGDGDGESTGKNTGASTAAPDYDPMQELYESTFGEAYIRRESYYADELSSEAGSKMGQSAGKQAVCRAIRALQTRNADAKSAVCQCACGMQAKSAGTRAAVCQCACGMQAKRADMKAAVCQCACGMQAKSAATRAAVCQCACGMQAKPSARNTVGAPVHMSA